MGECRSLGWMYCVFGIDGLNVDGHGVFEFNVFPRSR